MTKTKLAFVRCCLSCFSRRPVRFFPRLFPFACLLLFACRRFRCPALGLAGFFPRRIFRYRLSVFFLVFSFPPSGLLFSPSFPFCLSVVVRLSSFSLSGIGTCRLFPAADFSLSSFCFFSRLFLPAVRFAFFPVFSLLPVRCCSPVVVFAVRHWDLPAFPRGGFFAIVLLSFSSRCPVRFFPSFPFCLSVVVRLSSFSLSGNWDLPAFPRGGFFASGLLSFPSRRPVRFFPSFSFCRYFPSLFAFSFVAFCI